MKESRSISDVQPDDRDLQELLIAGCKDGIPPRDSRVLPRERAVVTAVASRPGPRQRGGERAVRPTPSRTVQGRGGRPPVRNHRRKRTRRVLWGTAIVLLLLLLAAGAVWIYGRAGGDEQEERDYACLTEKNFRTEDFEAFLAKYPDSAHAGEVKRRLGKLRSMYARWSLIESSVHAADFRQFMQAYPYPGCPLYLACERKADSLDWVYAATAHTREAVGAYLEQHPEGAYLMEARLALDAINEEQILREERAIEDSLARLVGEQNALLEN